MSDGTTQLSKYQQYLPTEPLTTVAKAMAYIEAMKRVAHVLGPLQVIDYIPPGHRVSVRIEIPDLTVDSKGNGRDVYRHPMWCGPDELALSAIFLRKLLNAAAVDIIESDRVDNGHDNNFCRWSILAALPQADGAKVLRRASKKLDFRPGSNDLKGFTPKQVEQAQSNIEGLCETKCMSRVAKVALALAHKYRATELATPFIVPVLVFEADMADPEIKRMVTAAKLGITNQLYGGPAKPTALIATGEVIDISGDDSDEPSASDSSSPPKEAAPQPATAISPPLKSPAAEVVSPIAWLPLTQQEIEQAPNDILPGGGTRRAWLGKLSVYASTVIEQHGRQLGGAAIARAIGGIDLATANGGDLSTIGQILRTEMQAGGVA